MIIRYLGLKPYTDSLNEMRQFTHARHDNTPDECWLLEHPAVYTQGQAGQPKHIIKPLMLPVVQSDRGGQITYHGPGQLICYLLLDLKRRKLSISALVNQLEECIIILLQQIEINAHRRCRAPGVYVDEKKIASVGLRIKNGCSYHGAALNIAMDLTPFNDINPCGFQGLAMTQVSTYHPAITVTDISTRFKPILLTHFSNQLCTY